MEREKETVLTDWALVAYLSLQREINVTPIVERGHVRFRCQGDVESALARLYKNEPIGVGDFISAIKRTRNMIFTLRGNK